MEKVTAAIGIVFGGGKNNLRDVEFAGERLADRYQPDDERDNSGLATILFKTDDGRFLVYAIERTLWQGEPTHSSLQEASLADLQPGGIFEYLGRKAGLSRALTLGEALA